MDFLSFPALLQMIFQVGAAEPALEPGSVLDVRGGRVGRVGLPFRRLTSGPLPAWGSVA